MTPGVLQDINAFARLSSADLPRVGAAIAASFGAGWAPEPASTGRGVGLVHEPTRLSFVAVAGGEFEMGLTDVDETALREQVPFDDDLSRYFEKVSRSWRPSHRVRVKPFMVLRRLLSRADLERLDGSLPGMTTGQKDVRASRAACHALAHQLGFRLPSEAELEWLARDGGRYTFTLDALRFVAAGEADSFKIPSRFAAEELFDGEWAEDDYHDGYAGAPATSDPWLSGEKFGVHRGGALPEYADGPQQMLPLIACMRYAELKQPRGREEREHMRLALPITV